MKDYIYYNSSRDLQYGGFRGWWGEKYGGIWGIRIHQTEKKGTSEWKEKEKG